jgi:hypothetical protein
MNSLLSCAPHLACCSASCLATALKGACVYKHVCVLLQYTVCCVCTVLHHADIGHSFSTRWPRLCCCLLTLISIMTSTAQHRSRTEVTPLIVEFPASPVTCIIKAPMVEDYVISTLTLLICLGGPKRPTHQQRLEVRKHTSTIDYRLLRICVHIQWCTYSAILYALCTAYTYRRSSA